MTAEKRPFIHINMAVDRCGSAGDGGSISCATDWRRVHGLRERCDAVAVGARTWMLDQPRLNARRDRLGREPRRQPARVIFAGSQQCIIPPEDRQTFVIGSTTPLAAASSFIHASDWQLHEPLDKLYRCGIRSMLVEGGPTLLRSFLQAGFVDSLTVFVRTHSAVAAVAAASELFADFAPSLEAMELGEGILLASRTLNRDFDLAVTVESVTFEV